MIRLSLIDDGHDDRHCKLATREADG